MKAPPKELLDRLPRTFVPALSEKFTKWDLLFPAEQRLLSAQVDWLATRSTSEFERLFAPVAAIERGMELPGYDHKATGMTIHNVAVLARSPQYEAWRAEVEKVFAAVDAATEPRLIRARRLVLCVLPAGLPVGKTNLWPDVTGGAWTRLDQPFRNVLKGLVNSLAARRLPTGLEDVEGSWLLEYDVRFDSDSHAGLHVLSWAGIEKLRREFNARLNVIRKNLQSADDTTAALQRMDLAPLLGPRLGEPRLREFVRDLLLSGNGALVFGNSFVQWGSSEALRRIQPQVLVARFGTRLKPKPFSSIVMFEDQKALNPAPDTPDPVGSLIDAELLATYVHLAADRLAPYRGRTITVFAAEDLDRMLIVGGDRGFFGSEPVSPEALSRCMLEWLQA